MSRKCVYAHAEAEGTCVDRTRLSLTRPGRVPRMAESANLLVTEQGDFSPSPQTSAVAKLTKKHGLKLGDRSELTIRRFRRGNGFAFLRANGRPVRDRTTLSRLKIPRNAPGI